MVIGVGVCRMSRPKECVKEVLSALFGSTIDSLDLKILGKIDYISFDIFDTLITRTCDSPQDVFGFVESLYHEYLPENKSIGFRDMRISAELAARRSVEYGQEVTLEKIYQNIPVRAFEREYLMDLEIACEIALTKRIDIVAKKLERLSLSYPIVLISDMYLPEWVIYELLNINNISCFEKVFLSSSYGCMKRGGELFKKALDELRVEPVQLLHIGDHPLADWIVPARLGMKSFLLRT